MQWKLQLGAAVFVCFAKSRDLTDTSFPLCAATPVQVFTGRCEDVLLSHEKRNKDWPGLGSPESMPPLCVHRGLNSLQATQWDGCGGGQQAVTATMNEDTVNDRAAEWACQQLCGFAQYWVFILFTFLCHNSTNNKHILQVETSVDSWVNMNTEIVFRAVCFGAVCSLVVKGKHATCHFMWSDRFIIC